MNFFKNKHYGFDYSNKDPEEDKNPDLYKINRLHKTLTENNYLTHAVMLAHNKELTEEQKQYHQKMMNKLFKEEYEKVEKKIIEIE